MAFNIYRNNSLIQMETYETDAERADRMVEEIRRKWVILRESGLADAYPIEILTHKGPKTKIVEVFKWESERSRAEAQSLGAYRNVQQTIASLSISEVLKEEFTEAVRGFQQNFPNSGGVELLKGVCSCLLTVDGIVKDYQMSVKNGIVLMHRSPSIDFDGDGRNEMYLKILMHGGEIVEDNLGAIRVEQNFSRPNDGIVKSNSIGGSDFPGTAIWRVSWKIQTALGPILTDPDQPLIFGPATVNHYPPVGTQFHSLTGPVKLVHEITGKRMGTLTPRELTAFDIVVTKDDEIFADILNKPPDDILEILNEQASKHALAEV
jgi:hypothetical protein